MTARKGGSATLEQAAGDPPVTEEQGEQQTPAPTTPVQTESRRPPALPTEPTITGTSLESKTIVVYGPAGIGKSTLASEFPNRIFFNCAGELNEIECIQVPTPSWEAFRANSWGLSEQYGNYGGVVIDTGDKLTEFCSDYVRAKLGIMHESDAEWGKGWDQLKRTLGVNLAKLAQLPDFGLIIVSHAKEIKIKTRNAEYNRFVPTLSGGTGDVVTDMADLVLFIDWAGEEGGDRVIKTKPHRNWIAKERGRKPRLAPEIMWPLGESGYELLKAAWTDND